MRVWWHLRQWIYAHPPVAVAATILLFLLVGFGGWQSARWFASDGAAQAANSLTYGVKAASTLRIEDKNGRLVGTRTITLPGQGHTVVVVKAVTRVVPTTMVRTGGVVTETTPGIVKTVTIASAQTVVTTRTVTHALDRTVTVTQTRTEAGTQIPPGHIRSTVTVTVTQAAATVTVTTSKGH
ncbi:MAG: hypothetical protein QOG75_6480 [Mycobacterium sp.]|nr:hypothetical protein [Mycobacterium sp.]